MSAHKTEKDDDHQHGAKPKRGRPSQGIPRNDTFRRSSKASREKLIESGKVELKCFVDPQTKEWLAGLKAEFSVPSVGEVLDVLAQRANKKV